MSDSCTVLIAAASVLPGLTQQFEAETTLLTFTDADVVRAVQAIVSQRPSRILLERLFATTPRGTALIARIKADASLAETEIRVVSHDGTYSRTVRRGRASRLPAGAPAGVRTPVPELDPTGTRRAPRYRIREGIDARVDGSAVTLVDLSALGAEVVSPTALRPNQRVQVTFADSEGPVTCRAVIVWASFERIQKDTNPCYRAGLEFLDADFEAIEAFCGRNGSV